MLRILTSILLASATVSGACWANQSEATVEKTKLQINDQNKKPEQTQTTVVIEDKASTTEIKLDEKTTSSLTPSNEAGKKDAAKPVASATLVQTPENNAQAQTDVTTDLKLVEFVLANQIVSREPKEVVEGFTEGSDRGFAFARINSKATTEVTFLWTRNGHEFARIVSPVHAAKQWRTFSSVKLRSGDWKVQLLDQNKVVLAEKSFTIQ